MPIIDGITATKIIKELIAESQIDWKVKIIIATAFTNKEDEINSIKAGADAFLLKPLSFI